MGVGEGWGNQQHRHGDNKESWWERRGAHQAGRALCLQHSQVNAAGSQPAISRPPVSTRPLSTRHTPRSAAAAASLTVAPARAAHPPPRAALPPPRATACRAQGRQRAATASAGSSVPSSTWWKRTTARHAASVPGGKGRCCASKNPGCSTVSGMTRKSSAAAAEARRERVSGWRSSCASGGGGGGGGGTWDGPEGWQQLGQPRRPYKAYQQRCRSHSTTERVHPTLGHGGTAGGRPPVHG